MLDRLKNRIRQFGRVEKIFFASLVLFVILEQTLPGGVFAVLAGLALLVTGIWLLIRLVRLTVRKTIWSLRNRLLVTYVFIAVIPVLLIVLLGGLGTYTLASQITVYLVTSELDRRAESLDRANGYIAHSDPEHRAAVMFRVGENFRTVSPDATFLVEDAGKRWQWPQDAQVLSPPPGWKNAKGILFRGGKYYVWSHILAGTAELTAVAPLTRDYLSEMVPGLAEVSFFRPGPSERDGPSPKARINIKGRGIQPLPNSPELIGKGLPERTNRADMEVYWASLSPASDWDHPGAPQFTSLLVHTRPSLILQTIFSRKADELQGFLPVLLLGVSILFLLVELTALVIGVSLTRTVTGAVHVLYAGTQRVIEGDFSFRIAVPRTDQLGELTTSFNVMTGKVERLLVVAKEKERMEAELEIAREVQNQLYPKTVPVMRTLRLHAMCHAARTVSGDYYDYQAVDGNQLALAIGDVAGKGISAALLMATLQSCMRAQMRTPVGLAAPGGGIAARAALSTSHLVSELNQQLYAFTSAEKYATFCFGLYDDNNGVFTYTNAGHLPPMLVRRGIACPLEVNGMVVGAFPFSQYDESSIQLESGDLLVCYTDGITEPENEYGEMFGEERLIELVTRNVDHDEGRIIRTVMEAVNEWTGAPELSDDMTLLLARKL